MKNISENILLYATYLLLFILPFPDGLLPMFIVIWMFAWLIWKLVHRKNYYKSNKYIRRGYLFFALWVSLSFISVFFTKTIDLSLIERRLFFLILPFVFINGVDIKINKVYLARSSLLGCIIALTIYILPVIFINHGFNFNNIQFRLFITDYKHPAYLALILNLSLFINISLEDKVNLKKGIGYLGVFLLFGLYIYIIRSRAGMIGFILTTVLSLWHISRYNIKKTIYLTIPFITIICFIFIGNDKFAYAFNKFNDSEPLRREILWQSSIELIKKRPLLGYGFGGAEEILIKQTYSNGVVDAFERRHNSHNQFLQSTLDNGVLGILILFLSLFFLWKGSDNRIISLGVVILIGISFLFESMLLRICGVAILSAYLIFISLPCSNRNKLKNTKHLLLLLGYIPLLILVLPIVIKTYNLSTPIESKDPKSYGYGNYSLVEKLPGLVPIEIDNLVLGYKLDSTATALKAYKHISLTSILEVAAEECDSIYFSSYCYVSSDFSGDAFIGASGKKYGGRSKYDLNNKSTWQYLSIMMEAPQKTSATFNLYMVSKNPEKICDIKGYVIFALPEYRVYKDGKIIKSTK